jgi:superfamily I DNA/RNA helicase/RecB family exonuclease
VTSLTQEQQAATSALMGPVRVVAGAGTGKTAVIAGRFRRLLEAGSEPAQILVMTFTERAAREMRERILAECRIADAPQVGTFHSLALRWLRDHGGRLGLRPGFRILAGPERWVLMRELMWGQADPALVGLERPDDLVLPLLELLERAKQELVSLDRLRAWAAHVQDPERRSVLAAAIRLFHAYGGRCRREGLVDFDDLLVDAVRLLQGHPDVREHLRGRHRWVLVDEYQDTNLAQERVVELVAGGAGNVCVVGDDDQSIYRFRGASRASMDRFLASFPSACTLALGGNLRSSRRIVAAAACLIQHNPERIDKPVAAALGAPEGDPVEVWACADGEQESAAIAAEVAAARARGVPWPRIAVLARTHAIARSVARALLAAGVPCQHWAERWLLRRPEVSDVIAYLRLLRDPNDLIALARLLARPPLSLPLTEALSRARAEPALGALAALKAWAPAAGWAELVERLADETSRLGVEELLFEVLSRTGHLDALVAQAGVEADRVAQSVTRFADLVGEYCDRRRDHSLGPFLDHLQLVLRSGLDEAGGEGDGALDAVQLMTIHQAKGLEFDLVFVPALVEGRLPQPRRREAMTAVAGLELPPQLLEPAVRGREDQLAEERRLFYVAMTRARERLVLSWAERYDGERLWKPSRFLGELGEGPVEHDLRGEAMAGGKPVSAFPVSHSSPRPRDGRGEGPTLSFSAIAAYRECPRQHWYRYQLGLPAATTVEAQLGTVLHRALHHAGRQLQSAGQLSKADLLDHHRAAWETVALVEPHRRPALEKLGRRLLGQLYDAGGLTGRPSLLEAPFRADLDGWSLRGVIDRIDEPERPDGAWRIVDYKSGSAVPASRLRRDLQLALYALGARQALDLHPLDMEIVYLRDGRRVTIEATEELLEGAARLGRDVAAAVSAGSFEPRPERRRCGLCPYRLACASAL